MKSVAFTMIAAVALYGVAIAVQEPAAAPVKVKLSRTYKAGESQAYTATFSLSPKSMPGEITGSAEFVLHTDAVVDGGAKVELAYKSMKMTFGGQEVPNEDLPDKTTADYDALGMQKELDPSSDDPLSWIMPAFCMPGGEVEIGKAFAIKWAASGDKVKIEGEGKLIATGMLYEEHVSKVSVTTTVSAKDEADAKFEYTAYFNTDTGKLVKAEGSITSSQAELGGDFSAKFTIAKVRSK
jgi:hypothetical protein